MKKIDIHLVKTNKNGLFHNSRLDVNNLATAVNILIEKVNELVDENNKKDQLIQQLKQSSNENT